MSKCKECGQRAPDGHDWCDDCRRWLPVYYAARRVYRERRALMRRIAERTTR